MISVWLDKKPLINRYPDGSKCLELHIGSPSNAIAFHIDPKLTHTGIWFRERRLGIFRGREGDFDFASVWRDNGK